MANESILCPVCGAPLKWNLLVPICVHHVAAVGPQLEMRQDTMMPRGQGYCSQCKQEFTFVKDGDSWSAVDSCFQNMVDMFVMDKRSDSRIHRDGGDI